MLDRLKNRIDSLGARVKRRQERLARYIELKRLSRIRKYNVPKYSNCKNCGEKLIGMYCHKCGQYALDVNQPFWKYINNFLENAYQLDGRVLQTLKYLFTRPGFLSKEYVRGRVNSYVHPLKLYMFVSIIFFSFVLAKYSNIDYADKMASTVAAMNNVSDSANLQVKQTANLDVQQSVGETIDKNKKSKKKFNGIDRRFYSDVYNSITKYVPFLLMLLMPLYAYILYRSNRRTEKVYLHSFVFSIHIHTLCLILFSIITLLFPYFKGWMYGVLLSLFVIYNIIAVRTFYERSWLISILKTIWNMSVYGFVLFVSLLTITILIVVHTAQNLEQL